MASILAGELFRRMAGDNGKVEALKKVHWVEPNLVAQIEFTQWTHSTDEGGPKLRAPVFLGLRDDKDPKECVLEE